MSTLITSSWSVTVERDRLTGVQANWLASYRATTKRLHSFREHPSRALLVIECDDEANAMNVHDILTGVLPDEAVNIVSFGEEI